MKRGKKSINVEQQARGLLGPLAAPNAYQQARTQLALAQAARQQQITQKVAGELMETATVRRLLVLSAAAFGARQRTLEKRFRAKFPSLPPEVYDWLRQANDDALTLMSADVLKPIKDDS